MPISNRFDVTFALQNFTYDEDTGSLYRRLVDGSLRRLTVVTDQKLLVTVAGVRYDAADIVWAIVYRNWPSHPLLVLGDDPEDLSIGNIVPVRGLRRRMRLKEVSGRFYHTLDKLGSYSTRAAAESAWHAHAARLYRLELNTILRLEADERELARESGLDIAIQYLPQKESVAKRTARPRAIPKNPAPRKPEAIAGRTWCWFEESWLDVPEAVHPADDWKLRCAAVKAGATAFHYDSTLGRPRRRHLLIKSDLQ